MYGIWPHLADDSHQWPDKHGGVRNEEEDALVEALDAKRRGHRDEDAEHPMK